ncbi:ML5 [Symbiodinium natans]|uniref:ML5 protein n=1 Tax=Symbiodinium natans TaxID=878477 RepID=A0A812RW43_9DINO|nr:ML5 [Symbiodinium natans]
MGRSSEIPCMAFTEPRLPPLPRVFVTLDDKSPESHRTLRRSSSFSGYTPFGRSEATFELDSNPEDPAESEAEVDPEFVLGNPGPDRADADPPTWPDTDDEDWDRGVAPSVTLMAPVETETWQGLPLLVTLAPMATETAMDEPLGESPDNGPVKVNLSLESAVPAPPVWNSPEIPRLLSTIGKSSASTKFDLLSTTPAMSPMEVGRAAGSPSGSPHFFAQEGVEHSIFSDSESHSSMASPTSSRPTDEITTMMIRGVPECMTQRQLLKELDQSGFLDLYDFCHMPRNFQHVANQGYAFVNFLTAETAKLFQNAWHKKKILGEPGSQPVVIVRAVVQGLQANMKKWCGLRMARIKNPDLKPFVSPQVLETFKVADETASSLDPNDCSPISPNKSRSMRVMQAQRAGAVALQRARALMPVGHLGNAQRLGSYAWPGV